MSIEPSDFYYVAEDLLKNKERFQSEEGLFRTVIGRYYYYLYLEVREIITSVDKGMEPELKGQNVVDAHKKIKNYIRDVYEKAKSSSESHGIEHYKIQSIKFLKNTLSNLLKMRKDSDYELERTIDSEKVNDAKERIMSIREDSMLEHFREVLQIVLSMDKN